MMRQLRIGAVLASLAFGMAGQALAAPITLQVSFSATGFSGTGLPADPFTGSFTVSFDNGGDIADASAGISGTLPAFPGLVLSFSYIAAADLLIVGGAANGAAAALPGDDDFALLLDAASTAPASSSLVVTTAGGDIAVADQVDVDATVTATPVPEPATALLLGVGLLGLAAARRR